MLMTVAKTEGTREEERADGRREAMSQRSSKSLLKPKSSKDPKTKNRPTLVLLFFCLMMMALVPGLRMMSLLMYTALLHKLPQLHHRNILKDVLRTKVSINTVHKQ